MLTRALASFPATRASVPGLLRRRTTKAGSSLKRYLARRSARLAWTGSLTIRRILPRPRAASADRLTMLTRASARVRASWASTPGRDLRLTVSWVVLGIVAPPPRWFCSIGMLLELETHELLKN